MCLKMASLQLISWMFMKNVGIPNLLESYLDPELYSSCVQSVSTDTCASVSVGEIRGMCWN